MKVIMTIVIVVAVITISNHFDNDGIAVIAGLMGGCMAYDIWRG